MSENIQTDEISYIIKERIEAFEITEDESTELTHKGFDDDEISQIVRYSKKMNLGIMLIAEAMTQLKETTIEQESKIFEIVAPSLPEFDECNHFLKLEKEPKKKHDQFGYVKRKFR